MNNEEFRKLIKSDGGHRKEEPTGKSTKEIAREAVEQEFREKRRKRGRDEDYLSDDDDVADDVRDRKRNDTRDDDDKLQGNYATSNVKVKKKPKYRDRARERREGKNEDLSNIASHLDEEMTKYLGGDEEYTHLVKGLDKTLAAKVRREEMALKSRHDENVDFDEIIEEAFSSKAKHVTVQSEAGALKIKNMTTLSTGMLSYLNRLENIKNKIRHSDLKRDVPYHAGNAILRSTLCFSLDANVCQRHKSWMIPEETVISAAQYDRASRPCILPCTPLDAKLIVKIKTVFSSLTRDTTVSSKIYGKSPSESKPKGTDDLPIGSESDEDIFGDIGDRKSVV